MSKLIDVFLYDGNHEHDMLKLRYLTLRKHVDAMVAVSCNLTHQGAYNPCDPPPAGLDLLWEVVMAKPLPEGAQSVWGGPYWCYVEAQHRNLIKEQLPQTLAGHGIELENTDIVMLSDLDEIPDPEFLNEIRYGVNVYGRVNIPMRMHGFALDYLYTDNQWVGTTVSAFGDMQPQLHRESRFTGLRVGSGWHFSWFGSLDDKKRKAQSFSHGELTDLDVKACWEEGMHANGEKLALLTKYDIENMTWPEPLFNGEFEIPWTWWAPIKHTNIWDTDIKVV
jgi:hypothetical protein